MARFSAENNPDNHAALKTPKAKPEKKSGSFKDFFKVGHSRPNLDASTSKSSPVASPPRPEHVEMPTVRQSRILDLDEWERVKEENRDLSHAEKIKLYKEREELRRRQANGGDEDVQNPSGLGVQDKRKDEEPFEIEGTATNEESTIGSDHQEPMTECELNSTREDAVELGADEPCQPCVHPTANSTAGDVDSHNLRLSNIQEEHGNSMSGDTSAPPETHSALDGSISWTTLHDEQQEQFPSEHLIQEGVDQFENESSCTSSISSLDRPIAGEMDGYNSFFSYHDSEEDGKVNDESFISASTTDMVREHYNFSSGTQTLKLGPFNVDSNTAMALTAIPAMLYWAVLFFAGMQGPLHFVVMAWKLGVIFVTYERVGSLLGWHEEGSRDIVLIPAEEICSVAKAYWVAALSTFFEGLAQAIVTASNNMDSDSDSDPGV